jgi:hypothetical protein
MLSRPARSRALPARALGVTGAALLTALACSHPGSPRDAVLLRTEVAPGVAAPGDTVLLRAILKNPTARTIELGGACGPPALFEVRRPDGLVVHPLPLGGFYTCPALDSHRLEPGEQDTVATWWRVPPGAGEYAVRSGFRAGTRLVDRSRPVPLRVP